MYEENLSFSLTGMPSITVSERPIMFGIAPTKQMTASIGLDCCTAQTAYFISSG